MIVLLDFEEIIPLLQAFDAQETVNSDAPRFDFDKETYRKASQLVNVCLGLAKDVEGLDNEFELANDVGFPQAVPTLAGALQRVLMTFYPTGAVISIKVMNRHGTIAISINPRVKSDARHYPFLQQYR